MEKQNVKITTEFIKLDQFLKFVGIAQTGGHSKEMIAEGFVRVNGQCCVQRGKKLRKGDVIELDHHCLVIV